VRHHGQDISKSIENSGFSKIRKWVIIEHKLKLSKARLASSRKWKKTWKPVLPTLYDSEVPHSPVFRPALVS